MSKDRREPLVQAMQIVGIDSFTHYKELPAKTHHAYTDMLGNYVILYPGKEIFWSWMEKTEFESNYTPVEEPAYAGFTYYALKD